MKQNFRGSFVVGAALLFSSLVFYSVPQRCEASVIGQLCSSVTSFLNDEAAKADADAKACKDKCGWKKRKDDLLDAARKKAKESCSKGEAPDVDELSKGLDRNTKDRLKDVYNRNSRMFDGKAKLEAANFGAVSSKDTAITGKGGQVANLKSSEPNLPKLNSGTEFSLANKATSFLASVKAALLPQKAEAALATDDCSSLSVPKQSSDCYALYIKQREGVKTDNEKSLNAWKNNKTACTNTACVSQANKMIASYTDRVRCDNDFLKRLNAAAGTCIAEKKKSCIAAGKEWLNNHCLVKCVGGQIRNKAGKCECPGAGQVFIGEKCGCPKGEIVGTKTGCGNACYDPDTERCSDGAVKLKCGGSWYDPAAARCVDDKVQPKCGSGYYIPTSDCCVNGKKSWIGTPQCKAITAGIAIKKDFKDENGKNIVTDISKLKPEIIRIFPDIVAIWKKNSAPTPTITSGNDGAHGGSYNIQNKTKTGWWTGWTCNKDDVCIDCSYEETCRDYSDSRHYEDEAIDVSVKGMSSVTARKVADQLQTKFGELYFVQFEEFKGENKVNNHIHIQRNR